MCMKKIGIIGGVIVSFVIAVLYMLNHPHKNEQEQAVKSHKDSVMAYNEELQAAYLIKIEPILQNPELPTGCEVTSLTTVLQYLNYDIDKCKLADDYLVKGKIGETNFRKAFVGNPRDQGSYGCYAEVIENCAQKYLQSVNSEQEVDAINVEEEETVVENLTGYRFTELYQYIQKDIPVIVWTTIDLQETYETAHWNVDGEEITWLKNEHCVVLVGYDQENVTVCDPLKGLVEYDAELFEERYEQLYSQAIVIYNR